MTIKTSNRPRLVLAVRVVVVVVLIATICFWGFRATSESRAIKDSGILPRAVVNTVPFNDDAGSWEIVMGQTLEGNTAIALLKKNATGCWKLYHYEVAEESPNSVAVISIVSQGGRIVHPMQNGLSTHAVKQQFICGTNALCPLETDNLLKFIPKGIMVEVWQGNECYLIRLVSTNSKNLLVNAFVDSLIENGYIDANR